MNNSFDFELRDKYCDKEFTIQKSEKLQSN